MAKAWYLAKDRLYLLDIPSWYMIFFIVYFIYYEDGEKMPVIKTEKLDCARATVKKQKIFTLNKLVSILECSSRTAQTKLKLWKAYTSYNQNGKYYTLPEIPQFDSFGLWRYKNAAFSKHGNLKKTIVQLVNSTSAGFSGKQLGELLGLSPQSFLHHFRGCPGIYRESGTAAGVPGGPAPETLAVINRFPD